MYKSYSSRKLLPLLTGVCFGLIIYWQVYKVTTVVCKNDQLHTSEFTKVPVTKVQKKRERIPTTSPPKTVKAKASRFNYDFRPYFVYSELGFKHPIVVAVKTSERNLRTFGVAINNTWSPEFHSVIFFTPYSRTENFHDKYVKQLNLNVVQLSDIMNTSPDIEFSFRILQYLKEHYINKYSWFVQTTDASYINSKNLFSFIQSLNSSSHVFIGKKTKQRRKVGCEHQNGIILSRTTLFELSPQNCPRKDNNMGLALSECLRKNLRVDCREGGDITNNLFLINDADKPITQTLDDGIIEKVSIISLLSSPRSILLIHKHFTTRRLNAAFDAIHNFQENIKNLQVKIPNGVPEKSLHWPIGFPAPFKPASRFEVIPWNYFDKQHLYGFTDLQPMNTFSSAYYKDFKEILTTVKRAIQRKTSTQLQFDLLNGYHRLDPRRGAEYVIDMKTYHKYTTETKIQRFQLLRPFSRVEPLSMPAATEQKGIHLILPVLKEEVSNFERFLQMYKRICLQTGENVVLLTVFINIRHGRFENDEKDDPFAESKNLIGRYKHSYMWAQLPWLQVGVQTPSRVLIMDIVSMKLPPNALIFFVTHDTDFTINFLNRCRVNVVSGVQAFFPIPFLEYDPDLVYAKKLKPAFAEIHKTTGMWDVDRSDVACFCNKDYKEVRMWRKDFLDENNKMNETILTVFRASKVHVFRAIEAELRTRFGQEKCSTFSGATEIKQCHARNAKRLGNRAQLAQVLFEKGYKPEWNSTLNYSLFT